jgi:hypothetical protein
MTKRARTESATMVDDGSTSTSTNRPTSMTSTITEDPVPVPVPVATLGNIPNVNNKDEITKQDDSTITTTTTTTEWYRYPPPLLLPGLGFEVKDRVYVKSKGAKPGKHATVVTVVPVVTHVQADSDADTATTQGLLHLQLPSVGAQKEESIVMTHNDNNNNKTVTSKNDVLGSSVSSSSANQDRVWIQYPSLEPHLRPGAGAAQSISMRRTRLLYCLPSVPRQPPTPPPSHSTPSSSSADSDSGNMSHHGTISSSTTRVLLTRTTTEYRQACLAHIMPQQDVVVEIGCSYGEATLLIHQKCTPKYLLALDTSPRALEAARRRCGLGLGCDDVTGTGTTGVTTGGKPRDDNSQTNNNNIAFECLDILKETRHFTEDILMPIATKHGPVTTVCVDIGGNRDLSSVVRVLQWLLLNQHNRHQHQQNNQPPCCVFSSDLIVIVKSEEMMDSLEAFILQTQEVVVDLQQKQQQQNMMMLSRIGLLREDVQWWQTLCASEERVSPSGGIRNNVHQHQHQVVNDENDNNNNNNSQLKQKPLYKHPLQAPQVFDNTDTSICRYHNYHKDGCLRHKDHNKTCPYNHTTCHACLVPGHRALECTTTT